MMGEYDGLIVMPLYVTVAGMPRTVANLVMDCHPNLMTIYRVERCSNQLLKLYQ